MKLDDRPIYTVQVPHASLCVPEDDTHVTGGRARAIAANLARAGYHDIVIVNHVSGEVHQVPAGFGAPYEGSGRTRG